MYCMICGTKLPDFASFCYQCGYPIKEEILKIGPDDDRGQMPKYLPEFKRSNLNTTHTLQERRTPSIGCGVQLELTDKKQGSGITQPSLKTTGTASSADTLKMASDNHGKANSTQPAPAGNRPEQKKERSSSHGTGDDMVEQLLGNANTASKAPDPPKAENVSAIKQKSISIEQRETDHSPFGAEIPETASQDGPAMYSFSDVNMEDDDEAGPDGISTVYEKAKAVKQAHPINPQIEISQTEFNQSADIPVDTNQTTVMDSENQDESGRAANDFDTDSDDNQKFDEFGEPVGKVQKKQMSKDRKKRLSNNLLAVGACLIVIVCVLFLMFH